MKRNVPHDALLQLAPFLGLVLTGCSGATMQPVVVAPQVQAASAEVQSVRVVATVHRDGEAIFNPTVLARLGQEVEVTGTEDGVPLAWAVEVDDAPDEGTYVVRARFREGGGPELRPVALVAAGQSATVEQTAGGHTWRFDVRVE